MSKTPASRSSGPLTWAQLDRWFSFRDMYGDVGNWKKAHIDGRLYTIAPAFEGIIDGLKGYRSDLSAAGRAEILRLATQTVGTFDAETSRRGGDLDRMLVVHDWMFRCALPLWFDRLPAWCVAGAVATPLRTLAPLLWTQQIVNGIALLCPSWIALLADEKNRGTGVERQAMCRAGVRATEALESIARALSRNLNQHGGRDDAWECQRALRVLGRDEDGHGDATIKQTLPALIRVLLALRPGDSRQSIADRCVWPEPSKTKKAA